MPLGAPGWLKEGLLAHVGKAQRFCLTLTMPGLRCAEQKAPWVRPGTLKEGCFAHPGSPQALDTTLTIPGILCALQ